jgi:hypothetical protein
VAAGKAFQEVFGIRAFPTAIGFSRLGDAATLMRFEGDRENADELSRFAHALRHAGRRG